MGGRRIRFLGAALVVVDADRRCAVRSSHEVVGMEPADALDESPDLTLVLDERVGEVAASRVVTDRRVHEPPFGRKPESGTTRAAALLDLQRPRAERKAILELAADA